MNKVAIAIFALLAAGCEREPCFDITALDSLITETQEWYVHDSIGNQTLTDVNGISQTLVISNAYSGSHENMVEDHCGNSYGSFHFFISYFTSISPLDMEIDIRGSGLPVDGFYLKLTIANSVTYERKSTTYDFVTESTRERNATFEYLQEVEISNKIYHEVFEIIFNNTSSENDIKTVFYAKGYGIIKFISANGIEFHVG